MKKILLIAAFVAGPILYAQQKPVSAKELQKAEIDKTEQSKTTQGKTTQSAGSALNVSDTKAVNKKAKAKATRKSSKASSFKNAVEN